jgi:hypothetical protein
VGAAVRLRFFRGQKEEQVELEREAEGEFLWTETFSEQCRIGIWQTFEVTFQLPAPVWMGSSDAWSSICDVLRKRILRDRGGEQLTGTAYSPQDVRDFLLGCDNEDVGAVVEAMWETLVFISQNKLDWLNPDEPFHPHLNSLFCSERTAYELVGGRLIQRNAVELHSEVVAPILPLVSGRAGWEDVEKSYQEALDELTQLLPSDRPDPSRMRGQQPWVTGDVGQEEGPSASRG